MITCQFEDGNNVRLRHVTCGTLVVVENKLLLVKRSQKMNYYPGSWCWPGGYLERDETLEEGALRELREETGYQGKIQELFVVNADPQRDVAQNIDFIFLVKEVTKVSEPDSETETATWFDLDNLPEEGQFAFDHYQIVKLYKEHLQKNRSLPIIRN